MRAIDFIRILYRHRVLLILTPVLLALTVVYLTLHPSFTYTSETTLFTGIASGESVGAGLNLSYFATNTSFDNLINITKSRDTKQDVALRLLAQHLLLKKAEPRFISTNSWNELQAMVPEYIREMVVRTDSILTDSIETPLYLVGINKTDFDQTVQNLKSCMEASDTNFVFKLLNYNHPHYSIDAISSIDVTRMESSDLVRLRYESDDPGICQQTLALFSAACIKNYKKIKVSNTDKIIRYFENELEKVIARLKASEDALLKFNQENNIINFYEQSKAVAVEKETIEREYNAMQIKLAGTDASIRRIEQKLKNQSKVVPKSTEIVQNRNKLAQINARITSAETKSTVNNVSNEQLVRLKVSAEKLKDELKQNVSDLYTLTNTTEGLPTQKLLNEWIDNVILYEDTKAGLQVQGNRMKEFQKQYAVYAPAGAKMMRIEREIKVNENEYLSLLRGMETAKLKAQDAEFTSGVKAVDPPYFPLNPNPTKRKMLVLVAAFFGFMLVLTLILAMEYFDNTLKNPIRAAKKMKLTNLGIFPKIFLKTNLLNFSYLANRVLDLALQNLGLYHSDSVENTKTKTILILSTLQQEGKSVIAGNLALRIKKQGKKVLYINYSANKKQVEPKKKNKGYPFISKLFGYEDTRVDNKSPFLQSPDNYLEKSEYAELSLTESCCSVKSYQDILTASGKTLPYEPEYVLIELPPILYYPIQVNLMASADHIILVSRANRVWTTADESILKNIQKTTKKEPVFILNGVESPVLESVLGELPKKSGVFHRLVKNIISLQFFNKQEI